MVQLPVQRRSTPCPARRIPHGNVLSAGRVSWRSTIGLLPTLLLAALILASPAHAAVRRCIGPDGGIIYTDRPCDQFNAHEQAAAPPSLAPDAVIDLDNPGPVRSDCARDPQTLLFDLRRAIETSNINGLAGLYHWPGMRGRASVSVMDRLEDIAADAGAAVDLVYPEAAFVVDNPAAYPDLPVENPTDVRISRYVDADSGRAPEQLLHLVRHAGCWWVHF